MNQGKLAGAGDSAFPLTPWSSILRGAGGDVEARREMFRRLLSIYWRPIYTSVRFGWDTDPELARARVQEYFHELLSGGQLERLDPEGGRFRDFLRERLVDFMERAGDAPAGETPQETGLADLTEAATLVAEPGDPESVFDREWIKLLIERALTKFTAEEGTGDEASPGSLFRLYDVEGTDRRPDELAAELGLSAEDLRDRLHDGRKAFRRAVAAEIHQYALDDQEAREELRWTIG